MKIEQVSVLRFSPALPESILYFLIHLWASLEVIRCSHTKPCLFTDWPSCFFFVFFFWEFLLWAPENNSVWVLTLGHLNTSTPCLEGSLRRAASWSSWPSTSRTQRMRFLGLFWTGVETTVIILKSWKRLDLMSLWIGSSDTETIMLTMHFSKR